MGTSTKSGPVPITQDQIEALSRRCEAVGLKYEHCSSPAIADFLEIKIPSGKETRTLQLFERVDAESLSSLRFEEFQFLSGFYALWSPQNAFIEAMVASGRVPSHVILRRELSRDQTPERETKPWRIRVASARNTSLQLSIGRATDEFSIIQGLRQDTGRRVFRKHGGRFFVESPLHFRIRRPITFRIDAITVNEHDKAVAALQKLGDSVFFQFEVRLESPEYVYIRREEEIDKKNRGFSDSQDKEPFQLLFPTMEYDPQPMSLYWYGCSATGMPLLQFLAFYQVIEYYFLTYAMKDAGKRIRNLLKDPSFRIEKDTDIARLVATFRASNVSRSFGNEKTQLRTTIQECLDQQELLTFITSDNDRKTFFESRVIEAHPITVDNSDRDIRNDVTDRIYDIRCRIVHGKSSEQTEIEPLLPFSKEAQNLNLDIELVKYVARKVLIASGAPLAI
jgi:hypothetical protein